MLKKQLFRILRDILSTNYLMERPCSMLGIDFISNSYYLRVVIYIP